MHRERGRERLALALALATGLVALMVLVGRLRPLTGAALVVAGLIWDAWFPINKGLEGELRTEAAGILRWILEGCAAWQRDGLLTPTAIRS